MTVIIYLLGLACIGYSAYLNLYPDQAFGSLKHLFESYQLKFLAAIPALIAALFLIAAPAATCPWLFWIVGLLAAIEAVIAFIDPQNIYSKMLDWLFANVSRQALRICSILGVIVGTLILTLAR